MNYNKKKISFQSIISSIQKVALYETKTKLYLVGSNECETRFRVLIVDRTSPGELHIEENPTDFDAKGIRKLVSQLGHCKKISAYGILGFVRFHESYYMILVTKRTRCAFIGMHLIYTIKDTVIVRVDEMPPKQPHPFEQRYLKLFMNIDLKSNFYFSYSYDLTRSLQYNVSPPRFVGENLNIDKDLALPDWNMKTDDSKDRLEYAFRGVSRKRFVWNAFLLKPMKDIVHRDWQIEIIHGFISQSNISVFGRPIYVCLIARRSTRFAGTRFLKRGANFTGDVANEVESEQIVIDGHRFCSFVQMRGSIPSHWSQDVSKMVPKPPISLDLPDPYSRTPGIHFERLLFQFGSPIIILNLVKKREKRKHESILTEEMLKSVKYLNQFLAPQHRIKYVHFDMARKSRGGCNVMESLADIAENVIQQTGMFFTDAVELHLQNGLVRVNCVDCLDRTNTAQFAIGKSALGIQLYKLGFIQSPKLEFESDCVTMLESLYEDHGDTLALQYGGSQLVHRIKTYRKTAVWKSQGNDIMQTLSRYYSNTFSDTEKQHSINLFLGYYIPYDNQMKGHVAIWDLPTDYYMHNIQTLRANELESRVPLTQWVNPIIIRHLPQSTSNNNKLVKELIRVHSKGLEMIDYYSNYHVPYKYTALEENIAFQISHLARNFMPTYRTNFSPFTPGRRREGRSSLNNPSLTGQSSTSSTTSSTSSSLEEGSSSDDDSVWGNRNRHLKIEVNVPVKFSFQSILLSMKEVYGSEPKQPLTSSLNAYKQYVGLAKFARKSSVNTIKPWTNCKLVNRSIQLLPISDYGQDCYEHVHYPIVDNKSDIQIYKNYTASSQTIYTNSSIKSSSLIMFHKYVEYTHM